MAEDEEARGSGVPTVAVTFPSVGLAPPHKFDIANLDKWPHWILQFEDYSFASGLHQVSGEGQVRTLLYTMGSEKARHVLEMLGLTTEEWGTFAAVREKFTEHFVHPLNEVYKSV